MLKIKTELGDKKVMRVGALAGRGPIPLIFVDPKAKISSQVYINSVL